MAAAMHDTETPRPSARERLAIEGEKLHAFVALAEPQPSKDGPLAGLTFVAKDMFSWPGHACSRGLASTIPYDGKPAVLLSQLVAEGAELLGFAEMTPLAYEPSGGNPFRARPINPLDADYICGGSSSGSAVLVAAGLADFAVGSDTAGSLRIPAQCCGIASWKPSFGLLCRAGSWPLAPSLDCVGLLARDVGMLLRVGSTIMPATSVQPQRFAIASDLVWPGEDDRTCVLQAARNFTVAPVALQPVLDLCDDVVLTLLQREAFDSNAALLAEGALDPVLAKRLSHGAAVTDAQYQAARAGLATLRAEIAEKLFEKTDVIALPVMPCKTPRVAQCEPGQPEFSARNLYDLSRYTRFVNALGLPAVSLPLPCNGGEMPSAVQLIARRGSGLAVLRAAHNLENLLKGSAA